MLVKEAKLFFQDGASDKVYNARIEPVGKDKFKVNFSYGRRGKNLTEGTKTARAVNFNKATEVFDGLVASKIKKGYQAVA